MTSIYTQEDLILYIYNELPEMEKASIATAVENDPELKRQYVILLETVNTLNTAYAEPSKASIDIILRHSEGTALETC